MAEVGLPAGRSGPTRSFLDTGYPLAQISIGPNPGFSCSVYAAIYFAGYVTISSGGRIRGVGGNYGGEPPSRTPSGYWKLSDFGDLGLSYVGIKVSHHDG